MIAAPPQLRSQPVVTFDESYVADILAEEKWATIRLPGEWDRPIVGERFQLQTPDEVAIGTAVARVITRMKAFWMRHYLRIADVGHRTYESGHELVAEVSGFYPDAEVDLQTRLDCLEWSAFRPSERFDKEGLA